MTTQALPYLQHAILKLIWARNGQPLALDEMCAALGFHKCTVRRHLHSLEDKGLVLAERRGGPGGAKLQLTERGAELCRE